ncbi:MAG: patatin-like phospholipase family protein [Bacteroidota bacterium]
MSKKYKIGLALSGGGLRGIAHIGVIQALREYNIEADAIIGVSAGAIIGSLYAAEQTTDQMMDFVKRFGILRSARFNFNFDGLSSLAFLKDHLSDWLGHDDFEQLEKDLFIGITNLNEGVLEVRDQGSLSTMVMASSAVPLIFKPVEMDGRVYIDGGVINNMPVEPLRSNCDLLIGVNVMPSDNVDTRTLSNVVGIATRLFHLSIVSTSSISVARCDVAIEPQGLGFYPIFKVLSKDYTGLVEIGYETAIKQMPFLLEKLEEMDAKFDNIPYL